MRYDGEQALAAPEHRSLDLYLLVTGGLLDAASDGTYVGYEDFDNAALKLSASLFLSLPIVAVSLSFWALVCTSYTNQKWRLITAIVEGGLWLAVVMGSLCTVLFSPDIF